MANVSQALSWNAEDEVSILDADITDDGGDGRKALGLDLPRFDGPPTPPATPDWTASLLGAPEPPEKLFGWETELMTFARFSMLTWFGS